MTPRWVPRHACLSHLQAVFAQRLALELRNIAEAVRLRAPGEETICASVVVSSLVAIPHATLLANPVL